MTGRGPSHPSDQVQDREKQDPDQIDKTPVKTDDFHGNRAKWFTPTPVNLLAGPSDQPDPHQHVQAMQCGRKKIKTVEQLRATSLWAA